MYEVLTGEPPFHALPPAQIFSAHLTTAPVPVQTLRADTPPELTSLVTQCLAKNPDDRPASADAVLASLSLKRLPPVPVSGESGQAQTPEWSLSPGPRRPRSGRPPESQNLLSEKSD